jgi:hypothetical protein
MTTPQTIEIAVTARNALQVSAKVYQLPTQRLGASLHPDQLCQLQQGARTQQSDQGCGGSPKVL